MSFLVDIISSYLLPSLLPKALLTKDGHLATPVIVAIGALPFAASWLWRYSHTIVEVTDPEQLRWIQHWLVQRQHEIRGVNKIRLLSAGSMIGSRAPRGSYRYDEGPNDDDDEREVGDRFSPPKLIETLANGVTAWLWYGWIPISIRYGSTNSNHNHHHPRNMWLMDENATTPGCHITVWFTIRHDHRVDVAKQILLEGRQLWLTKRATKTEILTLHEGMARYGEIDYQVVTRPSRPLSSVIIEGTMKDDLLEDITRFLSAEKWYISKGIPYRRGYLLHGPAGCGKTSLIMALAGHLRLPIVVVPLGGSIDDKTLRDALRIAPRDSMILFEDIDCALRGGSRNKSNKQEATAPNSDDHDHENDGPKQITLSGLLNAIDGVAAQEGRIIFMTTNYIHRLDEALIRPGRVDMQYHLDKASKQAAGELFDQFFVPEEYTTTTTAEGGGDATIISSSWHEARAKFVDAIEDGVHSFAKLQGALMKARDDPASAAEQLRVAMMATAVDDDDNDDIDKENDNPSELSHQAEEEEESKQNTNENGEG